MYIFVRQKLANLRIILYKECNKCDVTEQSASWDTCAITKVIFEISQLYLKNARSVEALYTAVVFFLFVNNLNVKTVNIAHENKSAVSTNISFAVI